MGKVSASALALHPISLPRAVNDSLQARISGGRMTQGGRLLSDCLAPKPQFGATIGKSTQNAGRAVQADRRQPAMTGILSTSLTGDRTSRWLGTHRQGAAWADLAGRQKYGRNVWREVNHAIGAGTHYHDPIRQYSNVLLKF
jgi:hypothetical protein